MHFARPEFLNLLWLVPLLAVFFMLALRSRRRRMERLIAPALVAQLTTEYSRFRTVMRAILLLAAFTFGILALARPQWGARLETVRRRGVDIMVALDTSYSMNAEDIAPTRLAKAKSEIRSLLGRLKGDRIGLLSFAGTALVQCPLTLDYGAAALFLDMANTEIIPEPGTSLAEAIKAANSAFIARERKYKALVMMTDGEDLEGQVDEAVEKAKEAGIIIYTIGIGTPEGKPIPVRDPQGNIVEYRKDPNGQVVVSSLDERGLARIAEATGGRYYRATTSESELDELYADISQLEKKDLESRLFQNYEDQFQYPLALALLSLAAECWMSERRRARASRFHRGHEFENTSRGSANAAA
jgi:Ca-activated chloride channel homolog